MVQRHEPDRAAPDGVAAGRKLLHATLLVLVGLLLPVLLELLLRLFLPAGLAGRDPFVGFSRLNPLFVPARSAQGEALLATATAKERWFNPQQFPAVKPAGTIRIFTLGGSTTFGHPWADPTSFSGWLRELLARRAAPGRSYEVVNAGGVSYASYRVVNVLRELLRYDPDLIVIMTGHNEFLESRTYGELLADSGTLGFRVREQASRLASYRLLGLAWDKLRGEPDGKTAAGRGQSAGNLLPAEVSTLLDQSAGLELYQRDTLFAAGVAGHYRYNLERMKALCREAGVPLLFLGLVDNRKDFSPFKSRHREGLTTQELERFGAAMSAGLALAAQGRLEEGLAGLREALSIDSLHAAARFYAGRMLLDAGDTTAAAAQLLAARELDICPLRAPGPIHQALREATRGADADLIDLPALFASLSPGALVGDEWLIDHIHPRPAGHLLIATEILGWMREKGLAEGEQPGPRELAALRDSVLASLPPEYFRKGVINLAKVLLWAQKYRETMLVLQGNWELLQELAEGRYLLGSALLRLDEPEAALAQLERARELEPDHLMVLFRLADVYGSLGKLEQAARVYQRINQLYPGNDAALSNYAVILGQLGEIDRALSLLLEVQRRDPSLAGLEANLGRLWLLKRDYPRAEEAFRRAVAIPSQAREGWYYLGVTHSLQGQYDQAERALLAALRLAPDYAEARTDLAAVYRRTGRPALAEEELRRVQAQTPAPMAGGK